MAQCPNCSRVVEGYRINDVMNRFGFIGRGQRVTCVGCGTRLAIRGAKVNILWLALLAAVFLQFVWFKRLPDDEARGVVILVAAALALYLHYKLAPRLVRLEVPAFGEADKTPLNLEMSRVTQEFEATEAPEAAESLPEEPAGPPVKWRCSSCREENPEGFGICWNCGAACER